MSEPLPDLICSFYKQMQYAPYVFRGWAENREDFGAIYIVNDDLWTFKEQQALKALAAKHDLFVELLEHRRPDGRWHGAGMSFNQGIAASDAEYFMLTSFDIVLPPDSVSLMREEAGPERIVIGLVHAIDEGVNIDDYPDFPIARRDLYEPIVAEIHAGVRKPYGSLLFRNGHLLGHKPTHQMIGGFDEGYCPLGYGLEDCDYGIRMMTEFDRETAVVYAHSEALHFAGEPGIKRADRQPDVGVYKRLNRAWLKYRQKYGEKLTLLGPVKKETE